MSASGQAAFDVGAVARAMVEGRFEGQVKHLCSVGSTNQMALEAAQVGAREGVWIADEQTAGRGRGGHEWHSTAGDGLYLSALVVPLMPLSQTFKLPLAVGLATQAAIRKVTGLACDLRWPNDLMFGDKKYGGILVESASEPLTEGLAPHLRYAVIGIGINVNHAVFPKELQQIATSLAMEAGRPFAREMVAVSLLQHLDMELDRLDKSEQDILLRFTVASTWAKGRRVRVDEGGGYTGMTSGLDANGFLLIEGDDGLIHTVLSGGVRSI